jgi:hypothetical protein
VGYLSNYKNSDIVKTVLTKLINIGGRKTDKGYAIKTINHLIKGLEGRYNFMKYIQIKDTRYSEEGDPISIQDNLNQVRPDKMGEAIKDIITQMDLNLGKKAGYFFLKEIMNTIGDDYYSYMKDLGVDLGILQLEKEIRELGKSIDKKNEI